MGYLVPYMNMLSVFARSFIVAEVAGAPVKSTTGVPEGCSMAVIAITCFAFIAHETLMRPCSSIEPALFVDNWAFATTSWRDFHLAFAAMTDFADAMQVTFAPNKCWTWGTKQEGRAKLKSVKL